MRIVYASDTRRKSKMSKKIIRRKYRIKDIIAYIVIAFVTLCVVALIVARLTVPWTFYLGENWRIQGTETGMSLQTKGCVLK